MNHGRGQLTAWAGVERGRQVIAEDAGDICLRLAHTRDSSKQKGLMAPARHFALFSARPIYRARSPEGAITGVAPLEPTRGALINNTKM